MDIVSEPTPGTACDCYPGGVSPEAYEGPQEWCEVHGQARAVLIQHRDAARALVDDLRAELGAAEQRAEELHERMESLRKVWLANEAMETLDAAFSQRFTRWDEEDYPDLTAVGGGS